MIRFFLFILFFISTPIYAGTVTSLSLIEKDGVTTNSYPLTFGHVFKQGDVTSGIVVKYNNTVLTTQFDKKTSWPDGSVKFGVISVIIPTVTANSSGALTIETGPSNSSDGAMSKTEILSTDVESNINLSNLSGSGYSGTAPSSLRDQINSGDLNYWLQGQVCTEVLETQQLNSSLNATWEARFYPGTSFGIKVSSGVENVSILYRGNVSYNVNILLGESLQNTVFSYPEVTTFQVTSITHNNTYNEATATIPGHNFETGNYVTVSGADLPEYNGTFYMRKVDQNTIIYKTTADPASSPASGTITASVGSHYHYHGSRWRKVFWIGQEPPETELHYDLKYLISTGAIANYDNAIPPSEETIASEYSAWQRGSHNIAGNGSIMMAFGTTGGRPDIGILPRWAARYLTSFDNRMKDIVIGNSEMAGHVARCHWREDDLTKSNYGGVVTVDDRVSYDLWGDTGGGIPAAIGNINKDLWGPDRAHMASFAYIPYLITGEYWHYMENMYWGAYAISADEYGRNGDGSHFDFSAGKDSSYGIIYDQMRGNAWGMRAITDAAFVSLDNSIEKSYFSEKLSNNIEWLYNANQDSHGLHAIRVPRQSESGNTTFKSIWRYDIAPWQHDFCVIVLDHIYNQKTAAQQFQVDYLLRYMSYFTIGRFANDPTFNKWDGAGYWWPLTEKGGTSYYNAGDWGSYWNEVLESDLYMGQGLPNTDYVKYDFYDSYLAIARAAVAVLYRYDEATAAYVLEFINENLTWQNLIESPTWAILPMRVSGMNYSARLKLTGNSRLMNGSGVFIH